MTIKGESNLCTFILKFPQNGKKPTDKQYRNIFFLKHSCNILLITVVYEYEKKNYLF